MSDSSSLGTQRGSGNPSKDVLSYQEATEVAHRAFRAGWIDLAELDQRLADISRAHSGAAALQSVTDLRDVERRLNRGMDSQAVTNRNKWIRLGLRTPFHFVVLATVVNVMIWAILYVNDTELPFWPVWLTIPLVVTFALYFAAGRVFGDND